MEILLLLFILLYIWIAWVRFDVGVAILFATLSSYLFRFSIGGLPTTVLELLVVSTILIGLYKFRPDIKPLLQSLRQRKPFLIGTGLLILGATIGVAVSSSTTSALGEWKAFYIEPLLLAFVLALAYRDNKRIERRVLQGISIAAVVLSLFTMWQTLAGGVFVPSGFWQSDGSFRATGWFGFPNGVAILLGLSYFPVLYYINKKNNKQKKRTRKKILITLLFLAAISMAKSSGAMLGILAGLTLLFAITTKYTKHIIIAAIILAVGIIALPGSSSLKQEVLLQNRSGQIRISMWQDTAKLLASSPLVGTGLASYSDSIKPYHTEVSGEQVEIFHHPHNIFLTMWVNTGIIGLVGFILLLIGIITHLVRTKQWYYLAFFTAFIVMGLVDSPYIKNDWSILFWSVALLSLLKE